MSGFGFRRDIANSRLDVEVAGGDVLQMTQTAITIPSGVTSGLTVVAGGISITAGGLTVTAGGLQVRGGTGDAFVQEFALADDTTAGNLTYTAAQLSSGVFTRDPNGSARTDVFADATDLIAAAALNLSVDGDTAICYFINTANGAETITMSGGTGITFANVGQTIAQDEAVIIVMRRTSSTAVTVYLIGA